MKKPDRIWAQASLICGVSSVFLAPPVFGLLGVAIGMEADWKGDNWWGADGLTGSAVAAVGYWGAGW